MLDVVLVEDRIARDRLQDEGTKEDRAEEQREAVLVEEAARSHWCSRPVTIARASPVAMKSV